MWGFRPLLEGTPPNGFRVLLRSWVNIIKDSEAHLQGAALKLAMVSTLLGCSYPRQEKATLGVLDQVWSGTRQTKSNKGAAQQLDARSVEVEEKLLISTGRYE